MRNFKQMVNERIRRMGYAAGFTVLRCEEEYEYKFAPGCIADEKLFLECDAGDEFAWSNDYEEVLHVEYTYFVFGEGKIEEATYEDLNWIEQNFEQIEVLCEPVMSGNYKLFNPYFREEEEHDD